MADLRRGAMCWDELNFFMFNLVLRQVLRLEQLQMMMRNTT